MANGLGSKQLKYNNLWDTWMQAREQPTPKGFEPIVPERRSEYIPERQPYPSELDYFKKNPYVGGMATEDNKIIINPYSTLSPTQKDAVRRNERTRIHMRISGNRPNFVITPEQQNIFKDYGLPQDIRETIIGRILSDDPSAGMVTPEQKTFAQNINKEMQTREQSSPNPYFLKPEDMVKVLNAVSPYDLYTNERVTPPQIDYPTSAFNISNRSGMGVPQGIYEHELAHYNDPRLRPEANNYGYLMGMGLPGNIAAREYPAIVAEDKFWDTKKRALGSKNVRKK